MGKVGVAGEGYPLAIKEVFDGKAVCNLIQLPGKERRRSHIKKLDNIAKHLKKEHKLITEGYYRGMGMIIGPAMGTGIGAALDNTGVGIAIGVAIGVVVGNYLDKKAEKEGRVI